MKPYESPYAAFANNPIWFIDPNGADTINGNDAIPEIKVLIKWSKRIEKNRDNIKKMIDNRNQIRDKIDNIETKQEYSEILNDINPFKKNPWHKAVDKNTKLNEKTIIALKVCYVLSELVINAQIAQFNADVEDYNNSLGSLHFDFMTMDEDDKLFLSNDAGTVFMEQNHTKQKAALRLTIDGYVYRFGFIESNQQALVKTLNSADGEDYIMPSLDLLGANAGDIIKAHPKYKEIYSKLTKDIQKGLQKQLKKL